MSLAEWSRQRLEQRRLRLAVQRHGAVLRRDLARSYGPAEHYTLEQVRAALVRVGVPPRHHRLMYAAFLPGSAFAVAGVPAGSGSYELLHQAFQAYEPLTMAPIASDALCTVEAIGALGSTEGDSGGH